MKLLLVAALTICGVLASPTTFNEPQCKAPNGGDLLALVDGFVKIFPIEKLSEIYLHSYCTDPEVRMVMEYLKSDKFRDFVTSLQKTREFHNLANFVCKNVYFDIYYYLKRIENIIGRPVEITKININNATQTSRGLQGLVSDITKNLPLGDISALFEEEKKTDKNVEKALEQLSSMEFLELTVDVRFTPEFMQMLEDLNATGANVEGVHLSVSFELLLLLLDSRVERAGFTCS